MSDEAISKVSKGPCAGRLEGKVALVTGAGGGQGRMISDIFAQAGARVFASDINEQSLAATKDFLAEKGLAIETEAVDAASEEQVSAWVDKAIKKAGRIDILYNNGGSGHMAPFPELTLEQWRETLRLECDVVFVPSRAVWPHMVKQGGGSIINIASCAGVLGAEDTGSTAHSTSKGGVISFTRQLATEGAVHGIRVNSIAPGPVMTPNIKLGYDQLPGIQRLFNLTIPLGRYGLPADVAYAGLFLASDESSFITGVNLPIDGGSTCRVGAVMKHVISA